MAVSTDNSGRPKLLFMTGQDPFSISVQMMTYSDVSHCAIVLPRVEGAADEMVIHAAGRGVKFEPRSKLYKKYRFLDIAEFEILPDVSYGVSYLLAQVGKPYDTEEVVSRVFLRIAQVASPWVRKSAVPSPGQWTCARLAMAIDPYRNIISEWRTLDPDSVVPIELLNASVNGLNFHRVK
jgi:hypothetical protein